MDKEQTILAAAALAQSTRLDVFRLLVSHEPEGLPAGEIARSLVVPHNTMSSHLAILTRAGLVHSARQSRSIVYRANIDGLREFATFLLEDCCGGRPELCNALTADLVPCCPPKK
jgi:ArsR family transcriptional regulator, arsenate/arsenite/antimonite-responsive transcriptional repressor